MFKHVKKKAGVLAKTTSISLAQFSSRKWISEISVETPLLDAIKMHNLERLKGRTAFGLRANQHAFRGEISALSALLEAKLAELQAEAVSFDKTTRYATFYKWTRDLNDIALRMDVLAFHVLRNSGAIPDVEGFVERVARLIQAGLAHWELRYGTIATCEQWTTQNERFRGYKSRDNLRKGISRLTRFAVRHGRHADLDAVVLPIIANRFDFKVRLLDGVANGFPLRSAITDAVSEATSLLLNVGLGQNGISSDPLEDRVFRQIIRNLAALGQFEEVVALRDRFELSWPAILESDTRDAIIEAQFHVGQNIADIEAALVAENTVSEDKILPHLIRLYILTERRELAKGILDRVSATGIGKLTTLRQFVAVANACLNEVEAGPALTKAKKGLARLSFDPEIAASAGFMSLAFRIEVLARHWLVVDDYHQATRMLVNEGNLAPGAAEMKPGGKAMLLYFDNDRVSPLLVLPLLPDLQKLGMQFFNLIDDAFTSPLVPVWPYRETPVSKDLPPQSGDLRLLNDWQVDFENRSIRCNGIELYQGFFERMSRYLRVFSVDWELYLAKVYFRDWQRTTDRIIYMLDQVRAELDQTDGELIVSSLQSQFIPGFALKMYAQTYPERFNHVTLNASYENWSTNVGGKPLSSLTLINNTVDPHPAAPFLGTSVEFHEWMDQVYEPDRAAYEDLVDRLINVERAGALSIEGAALLEQVSILKAKNEGCQVFCALGKIPYDLSVPYMGGPAHSDFKDWINHTVSSFKGSGNILLIKPHPHEARQDISHIPNESFLDMIDLSAVGENVIVLPHRGISLQELQNLVDMFVLWNGSSIPELGAQGLKVLACDDWAGLNYPISVAMPQDRIHYEAILRGETVVEMPSTFQSLSRAFIAYMAKAPFALEYPYVLRSSTNTQFNHSRIVWDAFSRLARGEASLDSARVARVFQPSAPPRDG